MSSRLGRALAEHIRRMRRPGERSFVVVEGVPTSVAEGMVEAWDRTGDTTLPQLAVVSSFPQRFGVHALRDISGTQLRNSRHNNGVVVVLCDGEQVPDRQSLSLFESVVPSVLLDSVEGMGILSQQEPPVDLDGPARAVREAIVLTHAASRPSALAVSRYLDRLAAGDDPLVALPALGAFTDHAPSGARVENGRVADNLALAGRRTSEDLLRPGAYADLRRRTEKVLSRRPSLANRSELYAVTNAVMRMLQSGSNELLEALNFDEAREVLEQRPLNLPTAVRDELVAYRRGLPKGSQAEALPWVTYEARAEALRRGAGQRDAAQELCNLDDAQQRKIFSRQTRTKLERLLRDKSVSGSNPSCPEAAFVRAAQQLGGLIDRVQVLFPTDTTSTNRTGAGQILTLACARLRLGALLRQWESAGGEIDGLLLKSASDFSTDPLDSFFDAGLSDGTELPALQLRLHSSDGSTVQVDWKPDLDDAAALRATLLFAAEPSLTLIQTAEPTLRAFCGPDNPRPLLPVPDSLLPLAQKLRTTARLLLDGGIDPKVLVAWTKSWVQACSELAPTADNDTAEALTLSGAVLGGDRATALTLLAPLKAEWVAQYHEALWRLVNRAEEPKSEIEPGDAAATATSLARTTAAHHPAHLRLRTQDRALLPTSEGRVWSLYGGSSIRDEGGFAGEALRSVVAQLLMLQPEAAGHLRCLSWGPGAADILTRQAVRIILGGVARTAVSKVEIFCIGTGPEDRPSWEALARADDELRGERDVLEIRYIDSLDDAIRLLRVSHGAPAVHLALATGITAGGQRLQIESPEVHPPADDGEVLFAPRVWQRPRQERRTLLMPPATTPSGQAWLRLQNAVEDAWPEPGEKIRVPEIRTGTLDIAVQMQKVHDLALWVATLDRYATRDSLEQALGRDNVAILHQERRLGGDSPLSLVLSQKSGGPADRAIGRSLRAAGIIAEPDVALSIGTQLRQVASQGYGILALQAATTGAGINELVGHVVAFSLLATTTTPWPLPPGCRVLLVSLDEYRQWFPGKRADLLAIALDPREGGVHVAAIEVKARRSDETDAASGALDQLNQTLAATRWAAYPDPDSVYSRLWLNRITEAAYAVARESRFKLDADELAALEAFRLGRGTLEWAGVGLVFGPNVTPFHKFYRAELAGDIVPVALHSIRLTEELLRTATSVKLTELRTVETTQAPLQGGRVRRRPEAQQVNRTPDREASIDDEQLSREPVDHQDGSPAEGESSVEADKDESEQRPTQVTTMQQPAASTFSAPILGWDAITGDEIRWHPAGPGQNVLQNGHVEIWGSSGMGKTQFTMSLLGQLARHSGSRFGVADFKNDYSNDTGFPAFADAEFLDLWNEGAPYNPLALETDSDRAIDTAIIELRDTVDEAAQAFTRMGRRQLAKLMNALREAYAVGRAEHRWPTLRTLDDQLDADLAGVMGDLTRNELFRAGRPLGDIIDRNVVFGLSTIPGNGQTTVLAAGFILSALLLRIQNLPPVPNTIRYVAVVDEAHRVTTFRAIKTMIREGRSKGLAVILATQQPLDLPDVVATNAATKICFGLPDATVATMAARKLDPNNPRLAEQIRTLGAGEALVGVGGSTPRLVRMAQAYRDAERLQLPSISRSQ